MKIPQNPYSPDWLLYWEQNPDLHKSVGAEAATAAADEGGEADTDDSGKTEDDAENKDAPSKDDLDAAISDEDWRSDLPDDLKKTAERFASKEDAVRAIIDFRKRESQVRVPGKDAGDDEIAAYRKAIGIPDKPENYEFTELKEGEELTDELKASREVWGQRFHKMNLPNNTVKALSDYINQDAKDYEKSQVEADKAFATSQEEALRSEWKGDDYDKNKTLANRAFNELANRAGINVDDLRNIETKDGRFLMDRAEMLRIFAPVGREMAEGTLGPALSETEQDSVDDEIRDVRKQIETAKAEGDSKRANKLFQKEQALITKKDGNKTVVGSGGRAV